jgi:hypothetical protein
MRLDCLPHLGAVQLGDAKSAATGERRERSAARRNNLGVQADSRTRACARRNGVTPCAWQS